jgi:hypothetical protein
MVGRVVTGERQRLTQLLERALTPTVERQLDALLEADEGMYRIRTLKHEPRSFSYQEMRQEVERRGFFEPLYVFARDFLMTTGLSNLLFDSYQDKITQNQRVKNFKFSPHEVF